MPRPSKSPTALTLSLLRKRGWTAQVVERHLPFPKPRGTKQDYLGCIDVLACHPEKRIIFGVQATSEGNGNARVEKAVALPELETWLRSGGRFEVWQWGKRGNFWHVRRLEISLRLVWDLLELRDVWKLQIGGWSKPER